jgi:hypothetical protein
MTPLTVSKLLEQLNTMLASGEINSQTPIKIQGCDCDGLAASMKLNKNDSIICHHGDTYDVVYEFKGPVLYVNRYKS